MGNLCKSSSTSPRHHGRANANINKSPTRWTAPVIVLGFASGLFRVSVLLSPARPPSAILEDGNQVKTSDHRPQGCYLSPFFSPTSVIRAENNEKGIFRIRIHSLGHVSADYRQSTVGLRHAGAIFKAATRLCLSVQNAQFCRID